MPTADPAAPYRLPAIPYLRLRAIFRAREPAHLPAFHGSLLRGAFGHALRRAVCAMGPEQPCATCPLRGPCVYTRLFETFLEGEAPPFLQGIETAPRPYVVEPRSAARELQAGDPLEADLLLLGQATELQGYAVLALGWMAEAGLGRRRARFELESVDYPAREGPAGAETLVWRPGYRAGGRRWPGTVEPLATIPAAGPAPGAARESAPEMLTVRFVTATRLKKNGSLQDRVSFRTLAFHALRRALEIAHCHVPGARPDWELKRLLDRAAAVRVTRSALRWHDQSRYSSRQKTTHPIGGFEGEIDLEGDLAPFLPLLRTAEILHVGKGATFGLGKVEILR